MVPAALTTAAGASVDAGALVGGLLELGTSVGVGALTGVAVADEPQATRKAATNRTNT